MGTRGEYLKDIGTEAAVSAIIVPALFGTLYAVGGSEFSAGAGTGLVTSLAISTARLYLTSPATRRYASARSRLKKSALEQSFYSVAPGHIGEYGAGPGTIQHRTGWLSNLWHSWRVRRMQGIEQAGADLRQTFAKPQRERVVVFYVGNAQLTYPVVSKFLRYAERNRDRGRGLSARYWMQRCRAEWWQPFWYEPMMQLIRIAQARGEIQLLHYDPRNGWTTLIHGASYTYGVILEHWTHKRYVMM